MYSYIISSVKLHMSQNFIRILSLFISASFGSCALSITQFRGNFTTFVFSPLSPSKTCSSNFKEQMEFQQHEEEEEQTAKLNLQCNFFLSPLFSLWSSLVVFLYSPYFTCGIYRLLNSCKIDILFADNLDQFEQQLFLR